MRKPPAIYSIGHSDHSMDGFVALLNKHRIGCIVDVRSSPYSKRIPQFNRELLKIDLKERRIDYLYLGDKLGGRYSGPGLLFEDKQVDFEKVRKSRRFIEGLDELIALAKGNKPVALMCAEKDPFNCHRFVLVSRALSLKGVEVRHILEDGNFIANEELDKKLLNKYMRGYGQGDLFEKAKTREEALAEAYRLRNRDMGYKNEAQPEVTR